MTLRFWIRKLFTRPATRTIRNAPRRVCLALEALEDRCCPSTFTVLNTLDDLNPGSLRWAVGQANMHTGADTINFDSSFSTPQTIALGGSQLELSDKTGLTTITGPAAGVTVSGGGHSRVFQVDSQVSASFWGLTITGGTATAGGGLYNLGTATLTDCTFSGNSATSNGGGLGNFGANSMATLTNCTVSGNSALGGGGLVNGGAATLTNCTVSGNSATNGGGGLLSSGTAMLTNTIVAGNTAPSAPDVSGTVSSQGHNLIGKTDGGRGWVGSDLKGTVANPLDPMLAPLGDNNGPTQTMALLLDSPAINAGTSVGAPTTDQRGFDRVGPVDIGAFESSFLPQTINFSSLAGKTYGDADFALSATATSGLLVSFTASGNASVSPDSGGMWHVHITGAGSATITAHQGGNASAGYAPAPDVAQSFTSAKAASTTTTVGAGPLTYTGSAQVGGSGMVSGAGTITGTATVTYSANADGTGVADRIDPGTYYVTAHYAGDANHTASDGAAVAVVINKVPTTTTTLGTSPFTYNGTIQIGGSGTVVGTDGLHTSATSLTYSSNANGTGVADRIDAGTYYVTAHYAGDAHHSASDGAAVAIVIKQATASITVTPFTSASTTYDGNAHTATGTATGIGVILSSGLNLSGTTHTIAGTYTGDGWSFHDASGNYQDASGMVDDSIAQASAVIVVTPYTSAFDGNAHTATGTATGVGGVNLSSGLNLSGTTRTIAGTYTDPWSFHDASGNYQVASGTVTDSIAQTTLNVQPTTWMGQLPDSIPLTDISLPGTSNSASGPSVGDAFFGNGSSSVVGSPTPLSYAAQGLHLTAAIADLVAIAAGGNNPVANAAAIAANTAALGADAASGASDTASGFALASDVADLVSGIAGAVQAKFAAASDAANTAAIAANAAAIAAGTAAGAVDATAGAADATAGVADAAAGVADATAGAADATAGAADATAAAADTAAAVQGAVDPVADGAAAVADGTAAAADTAAVIADTTAVAADAAVEAPNAAAVAADAATEAPNAAAVAADTAAQIANSTAGFANTLAAGGATVSALANTAAAVADGITANQFTTYASGINTTSTTGNNPANTAEQATLKALAVTEATAHAAAAAAETAAALANAAAAFAHGVAATANFAVVTAVSTAATANAAAATANGAAGIADGAAGIADGAAAIADGAAGIADGAAAIADGAAAGLDATAAAADVAAAAADATAVAADAAAITADALAVSLDVAAPIADAAAVAADAAAVALDIAAAVELGLNPVADGLAVAADIAAGVLDAAAATADAAAVAADIAAPIADALAVAADIAAPIADAAAVAADAAATTADVAAATTDVAATTADAAATAADEVAAAADEAAAAADETAAAADETAAAADAAATAACTAATEANEAATAADEVANTANKVATAAAAVANAADIAFMTEVAKVQTIESSVQTQSASIAGQLNAGIRSLDLRGALVNDTINLNDGQYFTGVTLQSTLNDMTSFLQAHPSETIVVSLSSNENPGGPVNSSNSFNTDLNNLLNLSDTAVSGHMYKDFMYYSSNPATTPTLGQVRGKIVIIPAVGDPWTPTRDRVTGQTLGWQPTQVVQDSPTVSDPAVRWNLAENNGNNSAGLIPTDLGNQNTLYRTNLSVAGTSSQATVQVADSVNAIAEQALANFHVTRTTGIVGIDSPDANLIADIINENNLPIMVTSDSDAPGATGTLRAAITLANSLPGVNTIEFAANLAGPTGQTIILLTDLPAVTGDLDIAGPVTIVTQHHLAFQHAATHTVTEVDFVASDSGPLTQVPTAYSPPIFVNTSNLTIYVTVTQQKAVLLEGQISTLINTGALSSGNGNSLISKLSAAAAGFASGSPTTGTNNLNAFINQVNTFATSVPPILTKAQAQTLISAANAIIVLANPLQLVSSVGNTITVSTAFNLTVTAIDVYGNVLPTYTGTVKFTDSVTGATLPGKYTFTTGTGTGKDHGVHIFTGLVLTKKGLQTITVADAKNGQLLGTLTVSVV